jgi:D-glycero-alpha-D-manno-heptose-7-phosphate kinase
MIGARAWCRVDLGGGTLDIWPLGLLHPGARTVNVAIDLPVEVRIRPLVFGYLVRQGDEEIQVASAEELRARPETAIAGQVIAELELPPAEITLASASPRGGGLGASSAMTVSLLAAAELFLGRPASSAARLATLARDLEARLMQLPTGVQDHYAALLGGALEIRHAAGETVVRALDVDLDALAEVLLVVHTGASHFSAGNNWEVIRRRLEGNPETTRELQGIAESAAAMPEALERGDWPRLGSLVSAEWAHRRRLHPAIPTPTIERLLDAARELGAWGGKACGAGGGGSVAILCPPERRDEISARLAAEGGSVLAARPTAASLSVARI